MDIEEVEKVEKVEKVETELGTRQIMRTKRIKLV